MRIYVDGNVLRKEDEWTPFVREVVARVSQRPRPRQIFASGILVGVANNAVFLPTLHIYTAAGTATETSPTNATSFEGEVWGGGGGGGAGAVSNEAGGGGGGGGFGQVNGSLAAGTLPATMVYVIGTGGTGDLFNVGGAPGGLSRIVVGTSTFTGGTGIGGGTPANTVTPGTGGLGGKGQTTNGNKGGVSSGATKGTGGPGLAGNVSGDGSPYAGGGLGGAIGGSGVVGGGGAVVFYYT